MSKNPNKKLNYLNLNSKSIINNQEIILADGKVSLISDEDFINKNGSVIKANDLTITSINGNITLNGKNNIENKGLFLKYIKILDYNKLTNYIK